MLFSVGGRGWWNGKYSHPTGKHLRPGTLALLKSSPAVARSGIISHFWLQGRKHFACRFMARPKPILNPPWEMHHTYMWVSLSVCVHPHACASFYGHTSFGFPRSPAFLFSNAFKLHLLCGLIKLSALDNLIVALKVVVKNHGSHKFQVGFIGEGLWLTALQNRDSENLKNMSFYNWKCVLKQMFKMPIKFCLWFANNSAFKMDIFPTLLLFPFVQFFFPDEQLLSVSLKARSEISHATWVSPAHTFLSENPPSLWLWLKAVCYGARLVCLSFAVHSRSFTSVGPATCQ